MVGWIILGVIVALIVLILLIPIGADLRYEEDGVVRISAVAAGMQIQLLPKPKREAKSEKPKREKKAKKPKKEKPKKEKETGEEKEKKGFSLPFNFEEILEILKTVLRGFGKFGRKFEVDRFVLHWIAGGRDPYVTARVFSVVNAGLSQLAPICEERFHCRDSSVWTDIDFTREDMLFHIGIRFKIRIGQIFGTVFGIGFGVLKIYLKSRRRVKRENREEKAALEAWLKDHPEDRARLEAEETPIEKSA
ncbi:MAG: hypothetical protein IJQ02_04955 [Oscillospiraceae bacterium]|nr:hypothetical protein [Oscillospiraceae bacterium]